MKRAVIFLLFALSPQARETSHESLRFLNASFETVWRKTRKYLSKESSSLQSFSLSLPLALSLFEMFALKPWENAVKCCEDLCQQFCWWWRWWSSRHEFAPSTVLYCCKLSSTLVAVTWGCPNKHKDKNKLRIVVREGRVRKETLPQSGSQLPSQNENIFFDFCDFLSSPLFLVYLNHKTFIQHCIFDPSRDCCGWPKVEEREKKLLKAKLAAKRCSLHSQTCCSRWRTVVVPSRVKGQKKKVSRKDSARERGKELSWQRSRTFYSAGNSNKRWLSCRTREKGEREIE